MDKKISFRPCTPMDVEAAVPLIYSSGPDAFDYVFKNEKNTAHEFLSSAFITSGGEFSFEHHHAVIQGEELIGIGTVFSSKQAATFALADFIKILKVYKWRTFGATARGLKIETNIKHPKKGEYTLAHIGVSEDHRGKGHGQKLMEYLMSLVQLEENQKFVLDVSEENPRAKALYDRMGFQVEELNLSTLKSNYGYVPNHYRMTLK